MAMEVRMTSTGRIRMKYEAEGELELRVWASQPQKAVSS
jgi:hypothetical protein